MKMEELQQLPALCFCRITGDVPFPKTTGAGGVKSVICR